MAAKIDTIFATFIRKISFLPCREFTLSEEFITEVKEVQKATYEDKEREASSQSCESSTESEVQVGKKEDKIWTKSEVQLEAQEDPLQSNPSSKTGVPAHPVERTCLPFIGKDNVHSKDKSHSVVVNVEMNDSILGGDDVRSEDGQSIADANDETDEAAETSYNDCSALVEADFGNDSDFDQSANFALAPSRNSVSRARRTKSRQRVSLLAKNYQEKKATDEKEDDIKERELILNKCLPLLYRTCSLCGLGCEVDDLAQCPSCTRVVHSCCIYAETSEPEECCRKFSASNAQKSKLPPGFSLDSFSVDITSLSEDYGAVKKTQFVTTRKRFWPKRSLINSIEQSAIRFSDVPNCVMTQYCIEESEVTDKSLSASRKRLQEDAFEVKRRYFPSLGGTTSPQQTLELTKPCGVPLAVLALMDTNCTDVAEEFNIIRDVFSIGSSKNSCDLYTSQSRQCKFVSPIHAKIYLNRDEQHFEILNYSQYGILVDDVLYCYENEKSVVKQTLNGMSNKNLSHENAPACNCENPLSSRVRNGTNELARLWDGPAALKHGSTIQIGCWTFIFVMP